MLLLVLLLIESCLFTSEWITHQHRDTYASIIGHPPLLSYIAVADGESIGRAKFEMCEVSTSAPCPAVLQLVS